MRFSYLPKGKFANIPKSPGVYALSAGKETLYIGKASNLRGRVKNHFQQPSSRDHFFIDQVRKIGYIQTPSEIEALLLESLLIKQHQPKYNVIWRDDKQYFYAALEPRGCKVRTAKLPRVFLTHQPAKKSLLLINASILGRSQQPAVFIGPFVDGKALKRTLRQLRKAFPYYTARAHPAGLCPYCHLGLCPGPNPNQKEYRKNINNLVAILQGRKTTVLKKLRKEMKHASSIQAYEQAAKLRDQMRDLEVIFSHARILQQDQEKRIAPWGETAAYLKRILRTREEILRIEAYDISNIQGKEATGSMAVFVAGKPAKEHYRRFKIRIAGKPNDFAMLQETITRRLGHEEWPYPQLMIIDGGKGQLSSALKALKKYKIHFPAAAIAKRHNEFFVLGSSRPILLKDMPQAVSNFILHIRDEAHRFAISYHRKLRSISSRL